MKIDLDTQIKTLLGIAEHIHTEFGSMDGCKGWSSEMERAHIAYEDAFEAFKSTFCEERRKRNKL